MNIFACHSLLFTFIAFNAHANPWTKGADLDFSNIQNKDEFKTIENRLLSRGMFFSINVLHDNKINPNTLDSMKPYQTLPIPKTESELEKCSQKQSVIQEACLIELARLYFSKDKFELAENLYEQIPNRSLFWPTIILERAWTNYKMQNFNRALGLLSTYKFPFLEPFKSSEVNYLQSLSYFRLCLWGDALFSLENFKKHDLPRFQEVENFLNSKTKDNKLMLNGSIKSQESWPSLLSDWVGTFKRENYWIRRQIQIGQITLEVKALESSPQTLYRDLIIKKLNRTKVNLQTELSQFFSLRLKQKMKDYQFMIDKIEALELEVLSASRKVFYAKKDQSLDRKAGDPEYSPTKKFQYFWDFDDEFWSDELGAYVFALKSQC
jgi:hypothetical protein